MTLAIALLALCPHATNGEDRAAQGKDLDVQVLRTVTVFEAKEHLNFPWVFRGPGRFLSMSCSIGVHTKTERGMALVSSDDGDTWAKPEEPSVGGMGTLLRDGRAVVLSCWGPKPNPDGAYPTTTSFFTNGGRKRNKAVAGTLTLPFAMAPHFHRSLVEMPDGSLLATIYGTQKGHKRCTSALVRTADGGKHWKCVSVIAHSEQVGREGFCEPAVVRLANGHLFCAMRTGGPLYTTRSSVDGRTWSTPEAVADHGVDPDLLLMTSGVLVLSYGRPNVDLQFSVDGTGRQWTPPMTLYRGPGCSYTSLAEGANHDLLVFFSQSGFCGGKGTGPLNMMRMVRLSVRRK